MTRLHAAVISSALLALCLGMTPLFAAPASAADAPDDAYVFGTQLIMTSPRQLGNANLYWADLLPKKYSYSQGSIIDAINADRAARGVTAEIDITTYPILLGNETKRGGNYEYNIDFMWMTPQDVDAALKAFPMTGKLGELARSYRPLKSGTFPSVDSVDGNSASVDLLGTTLTFTKDDNFNAFQAKVAAVLAARFGDRAKFDLSVDTVYMVSGDSNYGVSFTITVYLDGAESQALKEPEAP